MILALRSTLQREEVLLDEKKSEQRAKGKKGKEESKYPKIGIWVLVSDNHLWLVEWPLLC